MLPVDRVVVALAELGVVDERWREVDAWLDGDDVAGLEWEVDAKAWELVLGGLASG